MSDKILSYYDVVVRQRDLYLLDQGQWLNDQIIAFYYQYLSLLNKHSALFIAPAETFLLVNAASPQEAEMLVLEPRNFESFNLVFFALNNNPNVEQANGGSHWSLLVYDAQANICRHYDSCRTSNSHIAAKVFSTIKPYLRQGCRLEEAVDAPQQGNNYECGMYVLAISRRFLDSNSTGLGLVSLSDIDDAYVASMRTEIHDLILDLASQKYAWDGDDD